MTRHTPSVPPPPLPLSNATQIAEALELFLSPRDRLSGALLVLICDEQRRALTPIVVEDLRAMPREQRPSMLRNLAQVIEGAAPGACALVAVARPGPAEPTPTDEMWRREIVEAFDGRVDVFDVQLVTPFGSQTLIPTDLAA